VIHGGRAERALEAECGKASNLRATLQRMAVKSIAVKAPENSLNASERSFACLV